MPTKTPARELITFAVRTDNIGFSKRVLDILQELAQNSEKHMTVVEIGVRATLQSGFVPVFVHDGRFTRESQDGTRTERKSSQRLRVGSVDSVFADLCIAAHESYKNAPACIAVRKMNCSQCMNSDFTPLKDALENAVRRARKIVNRTSMQARGSNSSKRKQRAAAFKARSGKYATESETSTSA